MPLQKECCSLELARQLKTLGFKQNSLFYWDESDGVEDRLVYSPDIKLLELVSAFTSSELGEMLPKGFRTGKPFRREDDEKFVCDADLFDKWSYADTMANAMAKMLCYLKTNNLI